MHDWSIAEVVGEKARVQGGAHQDLHKKQKQLVLLLVRVVVYKILNVNYEFESMKRYEGGGRPQSDRQKQPIKTLPSMRNSQPGASLPTVLAQVVLDISVNLAA